MGCVVITGAAGYLGRLLASSWRLSGADPVLWCGELADDEPFLDIDPLEVEVIVHAAAVTRFNVCADLAEAVNVGGSRKLFEFAEHCPNLEKVVLLSTLYVAGLVSGEVPESVLSPPAAFANHYEASKWRAEQLLADEFDHLPWQIHRCATVIADGPTGRVGQYNALHNTLRLLHHGLLPVLPGRADIPIPLVTGAFAADASVAIARNGAEHQVTHIAQSVDDVLCLGELLEVAYTVSEETGRRPLPVPLVTLADFELLTAASRGLAGDVLSCAIDSVSPFAPQLFRPKHFETARLAELYDPFIADPRALVQHACREVLR